MSKISHFPFLQIFNLFCMNVSSDPISNFYIFEVGIPADFEKNAIETTSAQSPLNHSSKMHQFYVTSV